MAFGLVKKHVKGTKRRAVGSILQYQRSSDEGSRAGFQEVTNRREIVKGIQRIQDRVHSQVFVSSQRGVCICFSQHIPKLLFPHNGADCFVRLFLLLFLPPSSIFLPTALDSRAAPLSWQEEELRVCRSAPKPLLARQSPDNSALRYVTYLA